MIQLVKRFLPKMNDLGPVQQKVLSSIKDYYRINHKVVTIESLEEYSGMKTSTLTKAMNLLARKGRLRRISPKKGYVLLC